MPSYVSFITGNIVEPLYFIKVAEKGIAEEDISDPYNHFIGKGERYFKGQYLKQIRSRKLHYKQFEVLPTNIVISPDEIYDTHVDIHNDNADECEPIQFFNKESQPMTSYVCLMHCSNLNLSCFLYITMWLCIIYILEYFFQMCS